MSNKLYNQLNQPTAHQNNMLSQINQIQKDIQSSGLSPQQYFFQQVQKMGVDPNPIIEQAKQMSKMM